MRTSLLYTLAALLALPLAACGNEEPDVTVADPATTDPTTTDPAATDLAVGNADDAADRVDDALDADPTLGPLPLDADDDDGRIELTGATADAAQRDAAEALARTTAPGFTIVNETRVDPARANDAAADDAADRIEDAFDDDLALDPLDLDVDEEDGQVVLKGTATATQREQAEVRAREFAGDIPIVNRIDVR